MKIKYSIALMIGVSLLATACAQSAGNDQTGGINDPATSGVDVGDTTVEEETVITNDLPEGLNFNGETITILTRSEDQFREEFYSEEQNGDILNDTIYERNRDVSEKLNCAIEVVSKPGGWESRVSFLNDVVSEVMSGGGNYDIISCYAYSAPSLVMQEVVANLYDVDYLNLEKPWWHQRYVDSSTVYGKIYSIAGDICLSTVSYRYGLFFNKNLAEQYIDENLYDLVYDGQWTIDRFYNLTKDLYKDLNGNSARDTDDLYGCNIFAMYDAYAVGNQLTYTKKSSDGGYEWDFFTEKNADIIDRFTRLIKEPGVWYQDGVVSDDQFKNGERLFYPGKLNLTDKLRDMKDEYGLLPYPKYDENQENYLSAVDDNYSLVMVPITSSDMELAGAFLELTGEYSYNNLRPAYYETAMKGKYLRDDDSSKMFDIIVNGASYDFATSNSSVLGDPVFITRGSMQEKNGDFASQYASKETILQQKLTELLDTYKEG